MEFKFIIPRVIGDDLYFKTFTEPSLQKVGAHALQICDDPNKDTKETIYKKYNAGISTLKNMGLKDDDAVIFFHNDAGILDNFFREKIEYALTTKPEVGLFGIAGTSLLDESCMWWNPLFQQSQRGHLIQGKDNSENIGEGEHLVKGQIGYFDDLVALDGCILITRGKQLKEFLSFDDVTFAGYNDFYDLSLCMDVLLKGYKLAVIDVLIFHKSQGMGSLKLPWHEAKVKFIEKYTNRGLKFPITKEQFKFNNPQNNIVEIEV